MESIGGLLEASGLDGNIRAAGLHIVRILAMISVLPVFGTVPGRLQKLGLAFILGGAVIIARGFGSLHDPGDDPARMTALVLKEALFGFALGWSAGLVFDSVRIAGGLIATEMGLNMSSQVDPVSRTSQPVLSHFFESMAYVLFFTGGGAANVLRAMVGSFDGVPVGTFEPTPELAGSLLRFTGAMIEMSLRFAGPVFVLLLILTVVVGLLAKVAPALSILEASYPIRVLGALLMLAIFLPPMMRVFDGSVDAMSDGLMEFALGRG